MKIWSRLRTTRLRTDSWPSGSISFEARSNAVAHISEVAQPGAFVTRDVVGTPVIVVRGQDGELRAFLNVCRHRGATVELREHGQCRRFVCPYHAWAYDTDGKLAVVRQPEGFPTLDASSTGLVQIPCTQAAGLIWVCPDPKQAADGQDFLPAELTAEIESLGLHESVVFAKTTRVWNANWKLIIEGGLESYHFSIAHRKTIASAFLDNRSTFEFFGDHIRTVLPRRSILEIGDHATNDWQLRDHVHLVYNLHPNAMLLVQKAHIELFFLTPLSADSTRIDVMTVVPDPGPDGHSDKARNHWATNHAFTNTTLDEDFTLGEQIQRGVLTGANTHFRFAAFEGALTRWHRRMNEIVAGEPRIQS